MDIKKGLLTISLLSSFIYADTQADTSKLNNQVITDVQNTTNQLKGVQFKNVSNVNSVKNIVKENYTYKGFYLVKEMFRVNHIPSKVNIFDTDIQDKNLVEDLEDILNDVDGGFKSADDVKKQILKVHQELRDRGYFMVDISFKYDDFYRFTETEEEMVVIDENNETKEEKKHLLNISINVGNINKVFLNYKADSLKSEKIEKLFIELSSKNKNIYTINNIVRNVNKNMSNYKVYVKRKFYYKDIRKKTINEDINLQVLAIENKDTVTTTIGADNTGNETIGEIKLNAKVKIDDVITGTGDTLTISGLTTNKGYLKNAELDYTFSVLDYKLRTNGLIQEYDLGGEYEKYNINGKKISYGLGLTNNTDTLNIDVKKITYGDYMLDRLYQKERTIKKADINYIFGAKKIDTVEKDGKKYKVFNSSYNLGFTYTYGKVDIEKGNNDLKTIGGFHKLKLDAQYVKFLGNDFIFLTTAKAQTILDKNQNLDSSEDLSIAGRNGVKNYSTSEERTSGDVGYLINSQINYNVNSNNTLHIYGDYGRLVKVNNVDIYNDSKNNKNTLTGVSVGYTYTKKGFTFNVITNKQKETYLSASYKF